MKKDKQQYRRTFLLEFVQLSPQVFSLSLCFLVLFLSSVGGGCAGGSRGTGGPRSLRVTGVLTEAGSQNPIAGVVISLANSGIMTITDSEGMFSFDTDEVGESLLLNFNSDAISDSAEVNNIPLSAVAVFLEVEFDTGGNNVIITKVDIEDPTEVEPSPSAVNSLVPQGSEVPSSSQFASPMISPGASPIHSSPTGNPSPSPSGAPNLPDDETPPQLLSYEVLTASDTSVTMRVQSNESATANAVIESAGLSEDSSSYAMSHDLTFNGLTAETTYSVKITLVDVWGNVSSPSFESFSTTATPQLLIDSMGNRGADSGSVSQASALDMGSGASGFRTFSTSPDPNSIDQLELFSRHLVSPALGSKMTITLRTTFLDASEAFQNPPPGSQIMRLDNPENGFIEVWFEDGSGASASGSNPESYSDGQLILSGHFTGGNGSYAVDAPSQSGSVQLDFTVTFANTDYFFSKRPSSGTISFLIGVGGSSQVPDFVLSPGTSPITISDLDALEDFPDGGLNLR